MPNVRNDSEEESSTIDKLVETTFQEMRFGHEGHIESAANSAISKFNRRKDTESLSEDEWKKAVDQIKQKIEQSLPETFEYKIEHNIEEGWVLHIETGCPNCGNDAIFNGTLATSNQWVANGEEDEYTVCRVDDSMDQKIEFLSCGTCPEVLVDNRG